MSEKEYIVSLNKGVDYAAFNAEMIAATGAGAIPGRDVTVANARPASQRNTHYSLTDAEAEELKTDSRVYAVTLLPELDPDIGIGFDTTQTGNFTKTTLDRGDFLNWGMRRMNEIINPYTGVNAAAGGYNYTLDGSGVDVVIMDSGLQIDHPEFQDANGVSRVVELDWTSASGIVGMPAQNSNYYRDYDGHGTHVAGTAAGKTYGWAKNAKIYSLKLAGLEGTGDSGTGTSPTYAFDCIKEWHLAKPIDAATGAKRPTVVNMSWGYLRYYDTVTSMTYRGASKTGTDIDSTSKRWAFGLPAVWNGVRYATNLRIGSVDVDMEELIEAGVHVMVAAGNRSHKVDVVGGDDYDNVLVANTGSVNYQRGSSPYSVNAHIVGNVDSTINAGGLEQKAISSEAGPGVSVFAPGTDIMSAMSTTNKFGATTLNNPYPANSTFLINNISGTSMASPQVAGMTALWLQLNPSATPAQALAFVNTTAKTTALYNTGSPATDYTDTRSLLGATNRFAFNKFNSATQLTMGTVAEAAAPGAVATYSLSSSAASVNEGSSVTITLTTTNVANGTSIGYIVSGIESGDISESLTGNFTVTGNTATATFNITADATTEGVQTMLLSLVGIGESVSVTVNDTSTTPLVPAYAVAPAANNVDEGSALIFNVTTSNVADATTLYWSVTNAGDFATSTGSFTVTSNAATFSVTPTADTTTEGVETFTASVRTGSVSGTVVATSSAVTINDTSLTPGGGAASYSLGASSTSLQEGEKTTFTLTTANVADATSVPYTISGVNSSDLNTGPRASGAVGNTVGYGSNFFTREVRTAGVRLVSAGAVGGQTAVPDAFIEKVARMFQLFTDSAGAGINAGKQNQFIETLLGNTTSYHSPKPTIQRIARGAGGDYTPNFLDDAGIRSYGLEPLFDATVANDMVWYLNSSGTPGTGDEDAQEVIEHVFHTLHMHGLDAATLKMYPTISADWATSDLHAAMKEAADANMWNPSGYSPNWETDAGEFEVGVKEYLYLLNFCMFDYSSLWDGGSLAPEWSDSVKTPAGIQANNPLGYALFNTNIADVISKPSLATIRTIFQDGDVGDPTVAGASGYSADAPISLTGNFTVSSNTATLEINTAKDGTTDGDKTLALALDNAAASQNVSITDSSQNVGSTYYAYPAAQAIDEGSALTINVVTTDQSDGTLYWTIGSNASDFSLASGNFAITSDNGSFTVTPTADAGTEGAETFTVEIRTGSVSGNVVYTTNPITINDTSLTPTADYTINVVNNGASDYTLSGTDRNGAVSGNDPAIAFNNGDVVDFVVSASGHPFWIKTAQVTGTGSGAPGVTNNGTDSGTVQWTVGSTGTFYYICQLHSGMVGTITAS
jgi:subtilisin family serine protease/plastocyanin